MRLLVRHSTLIMPMLLLSEAESQSQEQNTSRCVTDYQARLLMRSSQVTLIYFMTVWHMILKVLTKKRMLIRQTVFQVISTFKPKISITLPATMLLPSSIDQPTAQRSRMGDVKVDYLPTNRHQSY